MVMLFGLFGAGGFGREVMPLVRACLQANFNEIELVFVVEREPVRSETLQRCKVWSMNQFLQHPCEKKFFNIAIADSKVRERLSREIIKVAEPFSVIAPSAIVLDAENEMGPGAILCSFTHVLANVKVGRFFHGNVYSYLAHDCEIGDFVTFAPGVKCNGNIKVEDHAYVGTGAVLRQGTKEKPLVIGRGAIVGMGAVVTKDVPPFSTVVGNPARLLTKN